MTWVLARMKNIYVGGVRHQLMSDWLRVVNEEKINTEIGVKSSKENT